MNKLLPILTVALCGTPALSAQTTDSFEAYSVGVGLAETIGVPLLNDTTVTGTGQGPGLVADGCTYSTTGATLQWNGDGWFGLTSRTLLANYPDLSLSYDVPTNSVSFTLAAFDGYGAAVSSVVIRSDNLQWSPIIDDHTYDGGSGMSLIIQGLCPGPMQLTLSGATPGGSVALAYGPLGSFTIPSGPCIGTVLGLSGPTLAGFFTADAAGGISLGFTPPAGLCGLSVQAVDMTTCLASQPIIL